MLLAKQDHKGEMMNQVVTYEKEGALTTIKNMFYYLIHQDEKSY